MSSTSWPLLRNSPSRAHHENTPTPNVRRMVGAKKRFNADIRLSWSRLLEATVDARSRHGNAISGPNRQRQRIPHGRTRSLRAGTVEREMEEGMSKQHAAEVSAIYAEGLKRAKANRSNKKQKFQIGDRIRIADDLGASMEHFPKGGLCHGGIYLRPSLRRRRLRLIQPDAGRDWLLRLVSRTSTHAH